MLAMATPAVYAAKGDQLLRGGRGGARCRDDEKAGTTPIAVSLPWFIEVRSLLGVVAVPGSRVRQADPIVGSGGGC